MPSSRKAVIVGHRALGVGVNVQRKLGGGKGFSLHASDFGIQWSIGILSFLQHDTLQKNVLEAQRERLRRVQKDNIHFEIAATTNTTYVEETSITG